MTPFQIFGSSDSIEPASVAGSIPDIWFGYGALSMVMIHYGWNIILIGHKAFPNLSSMVRILCW